MKKLLLLILILLLQIPVFPARSFNGSSDYLNIASSVVYSSATYPVTICGWVKPNSLTADMTVAAVAKASGGASFFRIYVRSVGSVRAQANNDADNAAGSSTSAGSVSVGTWAHICGVFTANNSRIVYLNGTAATAATNNVVTAATGVTLIGVNQRNGVFEDYCDCQIAEVSFWTVALSQAEITALAKGYSASFVRNQTALADYIKVDGTSRSYRGTSWTINGTSVSEHKPIFYSF